MRGATGATVAMSNPTGAVNANLQFSAASGAGGVSWGAYGAPVYSATTLSNSVTMSKGFIFTCYIIFWGKG